jgi:hypothetical protein
MDVAKFPTPASEVPQPPNTSHSKTPPLQQPCSNLIITVTVQRYEFEELNRLLPPHKQYAYDAIVAAGRSRFCDHKQDGEIVARMELAVAGG